MRGRGLFRRRERQVPGLNTSSLPDLIFTVLFFFMIVTHMRDVDLKVRYQVPQGSEVQKQDHKSSVVHIYIGRKIQSSANQQQDEFFIQLDNDIATIDDIKAFVEEERRQMNEEDRARMTVDIKADRDVPMGMIADVKQQLQQAFALKINYSANEP
ncbi:MAG: biopolymer transporter ExbD [Prevotella sp.]|jgi:biopolymer transport protein ExbD|nr:biopolymer transporter ExbD [Prevotella sp.]